MEEFLPRGRAKIAYKFLNPMPNDSILDVGCAQGYFERYFLIGKVSKVKGVDINLKAIEYCSKKDGKEYYLHCAAEKLPFQDNEFDKVLCLDTLEHVDDEVKTISEIRRVLRPNGLLVLSVPNDFLNFMDLSNIKFNFPRLYRLFCCLKEKNVGTLLSLSFTVITI